MREKLVELLEVDLSGSDGYEPELIADYLIDNGVTIQKWIPVTERLPGKGELVLCIGQRGGMFLGMSPNLYSDGSAYFYVPNARSCRYAIYWMPLPKTPIDK